MLFKYGYSTSIMLLKIFVNHFVIDRLYVTIYEYPEQMTKCS